jgi:hypothetical protein
MTLMTFAAALALSGLASTSAFAASTNNPQWEVAKEILGEGKSEAVEVFSQSSSQALHWPNMSGDIICTKIKAETPAAKITGSKSPNGGTDEETLMFEECEVRRAPECEINKEKAGKAKIKTNLLKSTLVFETKAGAESEAGQTLTLLQSKTTEVPKDLWAWIELTGPGCSAGRWALLGEVAAVNIKGEEELAAHELKFPALPMEKYFVNEAGKTVQKNLHRLTLGGVHLNWEGSTGLKLISKKLWKVLG